MLTTPEPAAAVLESTDPDGSFALSLSRPRQAPYPAGPARRR